MSEETRRREGHRAALVALGITAFVLGSAEFVIVGVLDLVASDLRVGVSVAGELVMAYALGIAVGGPLVAIATSRLDRRTALVITLALFVLGNIVMVFADRIGWLLAARFLPGSMHGAFVGIASVLAASVVKPGQEGKAMGQVFGGVALATVIGVPLGVIVAHALTWRLAFALIAGLGAITMIGVFFFVPSSGSRSQGQAPGQVRAAVSLRVLALLLLGMLLMGGQFAAYTYMAPFLHDVTGIPGSGISAMLLVYGAAGAVGMFLGGALADRGAAQILVTANVLLVAVLTILYAAGANRFLTAALLGVWGLVAFGLIPSLQLRVVGLAAEGADLAATLAASSINAGIAIGSVLGGWMLAEVSTRSVVLLAAGICALAFPLTIGTRAWKARPTRSNDRIGGELNESSL
jgi:DHA1 family inner membrane transport protein